MTRTSVQSQSVGTALLFTIGLGAFAPASFAQWDASRADSHAPIGVMGEHRHHKGELMISYRYMTMAMEGSRIGTDPIDDAQIVAAGGEGFLVTPTEMPMQMHMVGVMYGVSERVTAMFMFPYRVISMDHIMRSGGTFTTESQGLGDVKAGAMVGLADWSKQSLHLNALMSLPTGSTDEEDVLPISGGDEVQLPYPMQIGSGTFDVMPALTWLGQYGDWSWGAQAGATIHLGENNRDWTFGDVYSLTAWGARNLHRHVSASVRLTGSTVGNIDGSDSAPSVNPAVVPTARTDLRGGDTLEGGFGLNLYIPKLNAFRLAIEGMMPLYRNLDGPQLENDWTLTVGLQVVPIR
jgi:hypothetical protein